MQAEEHQNFYPIRPFFMWTLMGQGRWESLLSAFLYFLNTQDLVPVWSLSCQKAWHYQWISCLHFIHWLSCGVNFLVLTKVGATDVHFPIFTAHIRLCSTMNSFVYFNIGTLAKEFPTFITLIRLLSSVVFSGAQQVLSLWIKVLSQLPRIETFSPLWTLMLSASVFVAESSPAGIALVRFCSSVNSMVLKKVWFSPKGFPTFSTLKRLWTCVNSLVYFEAGVAAKNFSHDHCTCKALQIVNFLVWYKVGPVAKEYPTLLHS